MTFTHSRFLLLAVLVAPTLIGAYTGVETVEGSDSTSMTFEFPSAQSDSSRCAFLHVFGLEDEIDPHFFIPFPEPDVERTAGHEYAQAAAPETCHPLDRYDWRYVQVPDR